MKLIHLSDLHLGKRLEERSLLEEQEYILFRQILPILDTERPDALLIAGDVYDKSVPPAEAVTLFDNFLCQVAQRKIPVLLISGNHDSSERLAFGGRLMAGSGIHFAPVYRGEVKPITLSDQYGCVHFWLLPFLKPILVRRYFPDVDISSYTDALRSAIAAMPIDPSQRNVLVAHQFVTGAQTCESEEISVGGTDNVDASVFEAFDYVALGHLHGPQNVGSSRIRYCGTPLKYSASEASQHKSVTVVELGEKGDLRLSTLPLTPQHDLRQLRGTFAQLTDPANYRDTATDDYLFFTLTDEEDVPEASGRLKQIYPNFMSLRYDNQRTRQNQIITGAKDVPRKTPLTLFEELYERQNNQPMSEIQRNYAQDLIETIWEGNE